MSTLLLIRHGQARAFEADSDRLTPRGEEQARHLGAHLASSGALFDEAITGTLERQRQTEALVAGVYRSLGLPWPTARVRPAWDEYPADRILGLLLPKLAGMDAEVARRVADLQVAVAGADQNRFFQRVFEALMDAWEAGRVEDGSVESFAAFHARVRGGFDEVVDGAASRRVAVFTSGGPIGVCVQQVLEAPPRVALRVNHRVQNASVTELVFSTNRLSLDSFNGVAHLPPALRTFR